MVLLSVMYIYITPILRSLHWLRTTERIEYKLLSLTCNVLTITQPAYFHNLISVQRHRSTRSSSVVTLDRPPSSSSLKVTNRSFRFSSPRLWNLTPFISSSTSSWYQFLHFRLNYSFNHYFFLFDSPLCSSLTPSFFYSRLKTYLFQATYLYPSRVRSLVCNICLILLLKCFA